MPTSNSRVCSFHFKPEDFSTRFPVLESNESSISFIPRLIVDDIGVAAVPSIQTMNEEAGPSARDRRQVNSSLVIDSIYVLILRMISLIIVIYPTDPKRYCRNSQYRSWAAWRAKHCIHCWRRRNGGKHTNNVPSNRNCDFANRSFHSEWRLPQL